MKNSIRKTLLIISLALISATACVFSACSYNDQESIKEKEGFVHCVTYDANGGTYGSNVNKTYALVKENSLAPAPGYLDGATQVSIKIPTRTNHTLISDEPETNEEAIASKSWFLAKTDENGNVMRDEDGNAILQSTEPWDFAKDRVNGDITLVALWQEVYKFLIVCQDVDENDNPVEVIHRSYTVKPGDTIAERLYNKGQDWVDRADYIRVSDKNYTVLDFYMDSDLTVDFDFNLTHPGTREIQETVTDPETGEQTTQTVTTNDVKIYAKYLRGKFDLLTQESVKGKTLRLSENSKWYLLEDINLEYEGLTAGEMVNTEWNALEKFNGEIYGNGYSISNVEVYTTAIKPTAGSNYKAHSIFGTLNGKIENLTFKNVSLTVQASAYAENIIGEQRIALIAYKLGENASVKNLTVEDCYINLSNGDKFEESVNSQAGSLFFEISQSNAPTYVIKQAGETVDYIIPNEK